VCSIGWRPTARCSDRPRQSRLRSSNFSPADNTRVGRNVPPTSKSVRILHVGKFYPPHVGGIETHLQTLCAELRRHAEVKVVVANDERRASRAEIDGVDVARMGKLFDVAAAPVCAGMAREIRCSHADIVHLHTPNPTGALAYLASRHRGRLVVTWHSDILRQRILRRLVAPLERMVLELASAVVVTSDNYLKTSARLAPYRSKCHVIPYGIVLDRFDHAQDTQVEEIRRRFGPRIVLAVGRMVYYKGFEYLVRAMERVGATLVLIGDGPLRPALQKLAGELGIAGRIAFVGEMPNEAIAPYYRAAEVFVLPSVARTEAFGIVQIEAMASGTPVVNTGLDSGVPGVSLHRTTGLTVPPRDTERLAEAIRELLDDPALRGVYARNAKHRAHERFSSSAMSGSMLELYRNVIEGAATAAQHNGATRQSQSQPLSVAGG
jgi:glycosyltransferase involved in cell wall biosynthesis